MIGVLEDTSSGSVTEVSSADAVLPIACRLAISVPDSDSSHSATSEMSPLKYQSPAVLGSSAQAAEL